MRRRSYVVGLSSILCLIFAASAQADVPFGTIGSGAGQTQNPEGVATDLSNGRVYVADAGNHRIDVFDSNGEFLLAFGWGVADGTTNALQSCGPEATPPTASCFRGIGGSGPGQLGRPRSIAVDNQPGSPAQGNIYVVDSDDVIASVRVQKFNPAGEFLLKFGENNINFDIDPITVGPGGSIYVGDNVGDVNSKTEVARRIEKFEPSGLLAASFALEGTPYIRALAVDSSGDSAYVTRSGGVEKYELTGPNATFLYARDPGSEAVAVAVDSADNLFVAQDDGGSHVIAEYASDGTLLKRFGYGEIEWSLEGLAINAAGNIFASEENSGVPSSPGNRIIRIGLPPTGPLPCCLTSIPSNTKALLKGGVNPEGKPATYHFEYISDADFVANGNSFDGDGTHPATSTPESPPVGADFTLHPAEAEVGCPVPLNPPQPGCLAPGTSYHLRLVATNSDGKSEVEATFMTKPPFEIAETFATEVGTDAAIIHTAVNPLGIPATGYFEYVADASYQADKSEGHDGFSASLKFPDIDAGAAPIDFGSGETAKAASAQLSSLAPGATYHYRIVVTDPFVALPGPERAFTLFPGPLSPDNGCPNAVFRTGPSAPLPDCRAYEMVSPVDKNGGEIKVLGSAINFPARLEQSSTDGAAFAYSSITAFAGAVSAPWTSEYLATRHEGSGWSTAAISPRRELSHSQNSVYARYDIPYKAFSSDLSSGWLIHDSDPTLNECAPEGFVNLYRRDNSTGLYEALIPPKPSKLIGEEYAPELQGISSDNARAVFRANAKLTKNASNTTNSYQLYEHLKGEEGCGELRLVSILPNGEASTLQASAGTASGNSGEPYANAVSHAVSADGRRVFWSVSVIGEDPGPLYLRENADQALESSNCAEPAKACTVEVSAAKSQFWTAAADGSKAIYTVGPDPAHPARKDLYEFDTSKALAGESASTLIAEGTEGVVGASEDASRVYFVSTLALGGKGKAGEPNLYLHEVGVPPLFVATLYGGPTPLGGDLTRYFPKFGFAVARSEPIANGVRLTADGRHLAFVSSENLTGYDNKDAADGRPTLEIYLYDADTAKLACISCNPSGARPQGRLFESTNSPSETTKVAAQMAPGENQSFAPRAFSADGNRLFFESFEALLARDTNGQGDVYEWERGTSQKDCEGEGAELFVPSAGGCLSLISTGQSPTDSELADASPDGSNVFIRTASSLLPQDPGLVDLYDVRENGGLPQPPPQPAACEGEACQGPIGAPNDQTPASSAFRGAGNVREGAPKSRCAKGKAHRKKGRCATKKHAAKQHHRQAKRANSNRRAGR